MLDRFDAIIIGGGPSGSTAAILLARAGWSVALVEKGSFPRRKVCGECLAASNLPLLYALGVGDDFIASAGPELRRVALMRGRQAVVADLPAMSSLSPGRGFDQAWGRALGRETLDTLLMAQARAVGAQVLQPWCVQAITGHAGAYRCEIRSDAQTGGQAITLRAPLLIAANGSWENLPGDRATRRAQRKPGDLFAFKANFTNAALAVGLLPVLSFDGGYGGMVVADNGITSLACCIRRDRLDSCRRTAPGLSAGEAVERLLRAQCRGVGEALAGAHRVGAWLASGPIDPGIRLRSGDALFRIGNAAGEAHPIIGEGMSMAMQSAWLLCAELLRAQPQHQFEAAWQQQVQLRYVRQWRRYFAPRLRLAATFAHVAMRPALAAPLMAAVSRWPALLTQGARWGGKVNCAVPQTTLAWLGNTTTPSCLPASSSGPLPQQATTAEASHGQRQTESGITSSDHIRT